MSEKGIYEVHYKDNEKSKGIEQVKTVSINSDGTVDDFNIQFYTTIETKSSVILGIKYGYDEYYTVVDNKKCSKVEVIADKYIRSDANGVEEDNLSELPEF